MIVYFSFRNSNHNVKKPKFRTTSKSLHLPNKTNTKIISNIISRSFIINHKSRSRSRKRWLKATFTRSKWLWLRKRKLFLLLLCSSQWDLHRYRHRIHSVAGTAMLPSLCEPQKILCPFKITETEVSIGRIESIPLTFGQVKEAIN